MDWSAEVEKAFDDWFPRLYRYAASRLPGAEDEAEDVVGEAFLAFMSKMDGFRGDSSAYTWLFTVVRRKVADRWRRGSRLERLEDGEEPRSPYAGPETAALESAKRQAVRDALARMPREGRYALVMKYVEGFSQKDIARILGKSEKAAESVMTRARDIFRKLYAEVGG
jgi:RNA polymerase sigma-70 factor (ECF subfamily)